MHTPHVQAADPSKGSLPPRSPRAPLSTEPCLCCQLVHQSPRGPGRAHGRGNVASARRAAWHPQTPVLPAASPVRSSVQCEAGLCLPLLPGEEAPVTQQQSGRHAGPGLELLWVTCSSCWEQRGTKPPSQPVGHSGLSALCLLPRASPGLLLTGPGDRGLGSPGWGLPHAVTCYSHGVPSPCPAWRDPSAASRARLRGVLPGSGQPSDPSMLQLPPLGLPWAPL